MKQSHVSLFILLLTFAVPTLGQYGFDLICSDTSQEALPDSFVVYRFTLSNTGTFTDTFGLVLPPDSLPSDEWFSQLWIVGSPVSGGDTAYIGLLPDSSDTTIQVRIYTYSIYPSWGTGRATLFAWSEGDPAVRDSVILRIWISQFIRGDADGNGIVSLHDAIQCQRCQFVPGPWWCDCKDAVDADDSGSPTLGDCIRILRQQFIPGWQDSIPPPHTCGPDPTPDWNGCEEHSCMGGMPADAKGMRSVW